MIGLIRILIAPVIWLAAFSAIYGLQGLGCAAGWSEVTSLGIALNKALLGLAWIFAMLLQAAILIGFNRCPARSALIEKVTRLTAWTAIIATLYLLLPIMITSACL